MEITLIRSSTLIIAFGNMRVLFDPYLAPKGTGRSYAGQHVSPLTELPISVAEILDGLDAVLVSHLHSDHFDDAARDKLPKSIQILCHSRDAKQIEEWGFTNVLGFDQPITWRGISLTPTDGLHGPPEVLDDLGEVAGFVLKHPGEPTLYLAGDTIFCDPVTKTLQEHTPDVIVVHAAGAAWCGHSPIVMDELQVAALLSVSSRATVMATHLDTVDHATVTRLSLKASLHGLPPDDSARLRIPHDGETLVFSR